jgi:two-component system response regulator DesR
VRDHAPGSNDERRRRVLLAIGNGDASDQLRHLLGAQRDLEIVADTCDVREAARVAPGLRLDAVLLDVGSGSALDVVQALRGARPRPALIVLSDVDCRGYAATLARLGVEAVLPRAASPGEVVAATRAACVGRWDNPPTYAGPAPASGGQRADGRATVRELEVLRLVEIGCRDWDIARRLGIAERTVEEHLRHARDKLGAASRTEAVHLARKRGWIA